MDSLECMVPICGLVIMAFLIFSSKSQETAESKKMNEAIAREEARERDRKSDSFP